MSTFVVDASVGAKWWFPEAHREAALRLRSPAHDLHAPELFDVAATYDLTDFQEAVAEVGRPGKVGTVLLTTPVTRVKGNA